MSDESPFGDFSEQPAQTFDEDTPIAMPPPADNDTNEFDEGDSHDAPLDDDFGLSSAPQAVEDDQEEELQHTEDPFATVDGASSSNAGAFDSFSNQPAEIKEEEAEALKRWETERASILRDRASKAESDKQSLLASAREEVSKFYADRDATVVKQQKTNRADEKNYRSDMKSTFESGQRWEKVSKLVSTQPRPNEKAGTSRVERMRKLLVQLKTEKKA